MPRMAGQTRKRRGWFTFRMRSLLIFMTVVAAPLSWIAQQRMQSRREEQIAKRLEEYGAVEVTLGGPYDSLDLIGAKSPPSQWRRLTRTWLGDRVFSVVRQPRGVQDPAAQSLAAGIPPQLNQNLNQPRELSDLSIIAGLPSLERLSLPDANIKDLAPIARLYQLQSLKLSENPITDATPLAGLKQLKVLFLDGTRIKDLETLRGLRNLREVYVDRTKISDLSPLSDLRELRIVSIASTNVDDLSPLAGLQELEALCATETKAVDVRPLASLANLQTLRLSLSPVEDLAPLVGLSNLSVLELYGTKITDLTPLERLPSLRMITLRRMPIESSQVDALRKLLPGCSIDYGALPSP
jgi:Leucine-rich repeat (LRR) protein